MFLSNYPNPVVGGLEKQSMILAEELVNLNVNVQVLSGKFHKTQSSESIKNGVTIYRFHLLENRFLRYIFSPILIFFIFFKIRKRFDIVHVHQNSPIGLYVILLSKTFSKSVISKLPNIGIGGIPGILNSRFGRIRCWLLKKSGSIIAMTDESRSELRSINYPDEQIFFTPNGVKIYEKDKKSNESKNKVLKFVFLGRLNKNKDPHTLLKAWSIVLMKHSKEVKLEIWGDGELMDELLLYSKELNLGDSIYFAGHVDDANEKLNDMDILVLPSLVEGNSNSILEAMAAGLCIISTPVGGTPMLLGKAANHCLFEPGNAEELSEKLLFFIRNRDERLKVSNEMRQRVKEYFDIKVIASNYVKLYEMILNNLTDKITQLSKKINASSNHFR